MGNECAFYDDEQFNYCLFGVSSLSGEGYAAPEEVLNAFAPVHGFIEDALESGGSVLVHCLAGAHRAGTTGVSYMM